MKKAFTLIEILIAVAIMVSLMGIVVRLMGIGTDATSKNQTILRMQKLENALSGYYAAYGSYPPVPLHGHRNIFLDVNEHGIQYDDQEIPGVLDWKRVKAACRSQPVAVRFPFTSSSRHAAFVQGIVKALQEKANSGSPQFKEFANRAAVFNAGFDCIEGNVGRLDSMKDETSWTKVQIFQFGLLSYLLPRYLFMLQGDQGLYDGSFAQWSGNNRQLTDLRDGKKRSWTYVKNNWLGSDGKGSNSYMVSNQTSQAVCKRWLPNLEGIVSNGRTFYGVNTRCTEHGTYMGSCILDADNYNIEIFAPGDGYANQYVLDGMTVVDGWGQDFYYYSPPPYQTYVLWSSGPDKKTFPPWIDMSTLNSAQRAEAAGWTADDIVHLSN